MLLNNKIIKRENIIVRKYVFENIKNNVLNVFKKWFLSSKFNEFYVI